MGGEPHILFDPRGDEYETIVWTPILGDISQKRGRENQYRLQDFITSSIIR